VGKSDAVAAQGKNYGNSLSMRAHLSGTPKWTRKIETTRMKTARAHSFTAAPS
jgi:hypothetical protein